MSEFSKRILYPIALPIAALGVIAVMAFGGSRILLAVPEAWSVAIAFAIAATVLFYASVLSAVPTVKPSQRGLAMVLAVAVMGAGGWGLGKGGRTIEAHASGIPLVAQAIAWTEKELKVPVDAPFKVALDNQDAGIPHNLAIYADDSFSGAALFTGEIFSGVATKVYDIEPLKGGSYAFRCDVHPSMLGTITATEEAGAEGGEHG